MTQSQFEPVAITDQLLDRAELARSARRSRARDSPRSGPCLRHRHAPHHPHVPALDRAPRRHAGALVAAHARLRLRLRRVGDRRGAAWCQRHRRGRHRCGGRRRRTRQCRCQRRDRCTPQAPTSRRARYDLVLANILATPLRLLAPVLCAHVAAAGHLVLSGILERQADELTQAYAPWLDLSVADRRRRLDPDARAAWRVTAPANVRGMISA